MDEKELSCRQKTVSCIERLINEAESDGDIIVLPVYETMKVLKDALELLKEQESEWLEDSDPGQEYGTTWACRRCMHSIHEPFIWNPYDSGYKYCPHCGAEMKVKLDG